MSHDYWLHTYFILANQPRFVRRGPNRRPPTRSFIDRAMSALIVSRVQPETDRCFADEGHSELTGLPMRQVTRNSSNDLSQWRADRDRTTSRRTSRLPKTKRMRLLI